MKRMKTTVRDGLTLMRPWHACKNLLIFLPLFFHGGIFSAPEKMAAAAIGFAAFSLSASAIYALNDCRDAPQDRQHPRKKNRPVAAGRMICPLSSRQVKYLKVSDKNTYISFWSVGIFMHTISLYIF